MNYLYLIPLLAKFISCLGLQMRLPFICNRNRCMRSKEMSVTPTFERFFFFAPRQFFQPEVADLSPCKNTFLQPVVTSQFSPESALAPKYPACCWNALKELVAARGTFFQNHTGDFLGKAPLPEGPWTFWKSVKLNIVAPRFLCSLLNTCCPLRQPSPSDPHLYLWSPVGKSPPCSKLRQSCVLH